MVNYLNKLLNKSLSEEDCKAILEDYPVPDCATVKAPKLDVEVMEQLKSKGKDPQFGAERNLYKIQEHLLEVIGPLTSLWVDLLCLDGKVSKEHIVQQIQRALVLVGSTSHSINVERRRVAWARINPKLKPLAEEDYKDKEGNLLGPGFLEKASKKLEADRALAKVAQDGGRGQRKQPYEDDPKDLKRFCPMASRLSMVARRNNARTSHTTASLRIGRRNHTTPARSTSNMFSVQTPLLLRLQPVQPQAGRVSTCLLNWQEITSDPWVLQVVKGYRIKWIREPFQIMPAITLMKSEEASQLMEEEVQSLLARQAVEVALPCKDQFISRLFLVRKKDGSHWPVINLKPLNGYVQKQHFKMEGSGMVKDLLQSDDWMYSLDLKDAYHSVAIAKEHHRYLCFLWDGWVNEFTCLLLDSAVPPEPSRSCYAQQWFTCIHRRYN